MSTKTWTATRDARTVSTPSDMGAGACDHLCVGNYDGYDYHSHIGFTGISWSGIPNSASITSAVLEVYTTDAYHVAFSTNTIRVRDSGSFSEGSASHPMSGSNSITGANRPSYSSTGAVTFSGGTTQNAKKTRDITTIVKNNFGTDIYLALTADSGVCEFWSTESSYPPKIVVTYTAASAPNAPGVAVSGVDAAKITASQTPTITITHSDPQGDAAVRFDVMVMACSGNGVVPTWPADDVATGLAAYTFNNTTIATPITWVVGSTLTRGQWYAVKARTADSPSGDGAWSSPVWFKVHGALTAAWVSPSASTQVAPMYYDPGMNSVPKFNPQWSFSCPEGHGLQSGTFYVRDNGTNALLNGSGEAVAAGSTSLRSTYSPTNNLSTKFDLNLVCSGGMSVDLTQRTAIRARWARAAYKYPTTGATAFKPAAPSSTDTSTAKAVWEYGVSGGGTEPTSWYASATDVVGAYMHYRVTVVPLGNTNAPTSPTINSITLNWSRITATPYNWSLLTGAVIDTGQFLYGTQCLKLPGLNGSFPQAYQEVSGLQPDATYTVSAWVKTDGAAKPYIEVQEGGGGAQITASDSAYMDSRVGVWTRISVSFAAAGRSACRILLVSHSSATTGKFAWFDAIQMEASSVITPWKPGFVGQALAIDAGGIIVDGSATGGGIFRLEGADYDPGTAPRAVVALGAKGLKFGGSTDPVEIESPSAAVIKVGGGSAAVLAKPPVTRLYTSGTSQTWTKPADLNYIMLELVGGGGGGGGAGDPNAYGTVGGGGGGGGYVRAVIPASQLAGNLTYTVGGGGTAGSTSGGDGGAGGNSTVTDGNWTLTAYGGSGGGGLGTPSDGTSNAYSGAGGSAASTMGTATFVPIITAGACGGNGYVRNSSPQNTGFGGASHLGGGGEAAQGADADGSSGRQYGGGGGGGSKGSDGTGNNGGAGAGGCVIITEFYGP
jgi:hypothetical protein